MVAKVNWYERLSARQLEIALLVHRAMTNDEIAHLLNITPGTVSAQMQIVYTKGGFRNRVELAIAVEREFAKIKENPMAMTGSVYGNRDSVRCKSCKKDVNYGDPVVQCEECAQKFCSQTCKESHKCPKGFTR